MSRLNNDINGKESTKRKLGMRLLNIGIAIALLHIAVGLGLSIAGKEYNYTLPFQIWVTFMGTGTGLLGFTLFEKISKK